MANDPPIIDLAREKRRRAYDTLWPIMASDPILRNDQNLVDAASLFPATSREAAGPTKPARDRGDGQKQVAVFHAEAAGKFALLCFEVLGAGVKRLSNRSLVTHTMLGRVAHICRGSRAILDARYLSRDSGFAESGLRKREVHDAGMKVPNRTPNCRYVV